MSFKGFLSTTIMLTVSGAAIALPDQAEQTTSGYSYTLHTTRPSTEDLGQFPPQYKDPTVEHVLQGPEHTLIWRDRVSDRNADNASFAMGERHMGLYIPHWPKDKPASEATGWNEYGEKITYTNFSVEVERIEGDREIAGGMAKHYLLTADYTRHPENDASAREQMHSDLWVLTDKPFSWAPFHTPGGYADPRFGAAVAAKLSKLGMVVRSDARYSSVGVDDDGQEVGTRHEGTWTTWIVDLEPAEVPVVNMPVGDYITLELLQDEFRKQPDETCKAVMAGESPNFIKQNLSSNQQAAVMKDLSESCKRNTMRAFARSMKKDPQSVCGGILDGETPDVVSQTLDENEKQDFMKGAVSFCENQTID